MSHKQRTLTTSMLKNSALLLCALLIQFTVSLSSSAATASSSVINSNVVSGDFVYVQEGDGSLLQYHVSKVDYQGTQAWQISWQCDQLTATHFLRTSDGKPLYVKRVNHVLKRTIEITYSQDADLPTIYRKESADELIERKIWDKELQDLGSLPQILTRVVQSQGEQKKLTFSAINYDDGKVYKLVAKQMGFRRVSTDKDSIRCAIYDVKLDSWLSSFVPKTRLLIPLEKDSSNFVTYNGPGLDSVADAWSLRLVGKGRSLAMAPHKKSNTQ